ncbi:MAG: alpha/beta hydrolase, partial [Thalassolituus sp.]
ISTIYATKYPEHLASLILIDSAGMDGANKSEYFQMLEQGTNPLIADDKESFEFRMDMVMSQPPALPWPLRPALVRDTVARAPLNREIFADMIATRERMSGPEYEALVDEKVEMPALIMWGKEDRVLDVSAVEAFKQIIPQAAVTIYEEVGHVPMLEIPEESAMTVAAFINGLD